MIVSQKFLNAVKLSDRRAYKIALEAGLHPSTLSKIICKIERVKPQDPRVLAVARVLGLPPEECFQSDTICEEVRGR
jgi:hypothetical protein